MGSIGKIEDLCYFGSGHDPELLSERVAAKLLYRADISYFAALALAACGILGITFRDKLTALTVPAAGRFFFQFITAEWA